MPGGDRTGPNGMGPMTGRGMGFCRGGRGRGFFAGSRDLRAQSRPTSSEKELLEQELLALKEEIKDIEERLEELK